MTAEIISGTKIAAEIREELKEKVRDLKAKKGVTPGLVMVRVGEDPASVSYVMAKTKASDDLGIYSETIVFPEDTSEKELLAKIGELNSYKAQPAFLDPYKKGWEMAIEEINAKGGVLGKKLEVISRDDGANPGEAVRVAEELVTREGVAMIAGTFLSHIGLAVTNFAGQKKVFFLAAEPLTDKITWQNALRLVPLEREP